MTVTESSDAPVEVVVEGPADPDEVERERHNATIDRIADRMLDTPGVPGRDEFLNLCLQAKLLSMSAALPKGMRGNPHLCLHVVLLARDLGMSPPTALNLIDYIPENRDHPEQGGRLSLSPELLSAQVRRLGLGRIEILRQDALSAVAIALEPGGFIERDLDGGPVRIVGEIGRSEFTWADAIEAGLVDSRCPAPGHHWVKPGTSGKAYSDRCDCRTGWRGYPKRMLAWRAKGYAAADHFPEASVGLYSPEELGAEVDDQGRMIDPATMDVPAGYELAPPPPPVGVVPADSPELDALKMGIACLDAEGRQAVKERLAGKIPAIGSPIFTESHLRLAGSVLRGVEGERARAGWDKEAATAAYLAHLAGPIPVADPETGEIAPEAAPAASEAPPVAEAFQPDPDPVPAAETAAQVAGVDIPADNGYRSDLDKVFAEDGIDVLLFELQTWSPEKLAADLEARGVAIDPETMTVAEIPKRLGAIVIGWAKSTTRR